MEQGQLFTHPAAGDERGCVSAVLCLQWLINHDTRLLGESTNRTKSSSLSHPSSLCLLSRVCVCVAARTVTLAGMRPPLHALEQDIDCSAPLTPLHFLALLPHLMPTKK